jgi:hypothetical protein
MDAEVILDPSARGTVMLCDDVVAELTDYRGGLNQPARTMAAIVNTAQRFVLSPLIVDTVEKLLDEGKLRHMASHLFLPARRTWIEWTDDSGHFSGGRQAILLIGTLILENSAPPPYPIDSPAHIKSGWIFRFCRPVLPPAFGSVGEMVPFDLVRGDLGNSKTALWAWGAISLINAPHITEHHPHEIGRQGQARPRKPHLSYVDVVLTPDAGEVVRGRGVTETGARSLHHVRAHLRLKGGRVEIVRPHWRGQAKNGIRLSRHVVRRAEDTPGTWQGGPLPGPRMLDQRDEN